MFCGIRGSGLEEFLFGLVDALLGEFYAREHERIRASVIVFSARTQVFIWDDLLTFARCFYLGDNLKLFIESVLGFPRRGVNIVAIVVD